MKLEWTSVRPSGGVRFLLLTLAVAVFTLASLLAFHAARHPLGLAAFSRARPLTAGRAAPEFELEALSGGVVRLAELQGRVVVLNLWATWCGSCRAELSALSDLASSFEGDRVVVLAVNRAEPAEAVRAYLTEHGIDLPVALSTQEMLLAYGDDGSLPDTWVIDPNGVVRLHLSGFGSGTHRTLVESVRRWLPETDRAEESSPVGGRPDPT